MQKEGTPGAPREVAETTPSNGACPTDAKAGGGCSFFKQHRVRVRVRALNDGPGIARVAVGRSDAPPPEGLREAANPNSSSYPGDFVQENTTGGGPQLGPLSAYFVEPIDKGQ